jgi:hypothetical protein
MPKKGKVTGSNYRIGCHPFKAAVNQWLANLTRKVVSSNDSWALLLESEATLTVHSLTKSSVSITSTNNTREPEEKQTSDSLSNNHPPVFQECNILIPQPDSNQLTKIKNACPSVHILPLTSHQLLTQLSSDQSCYQDEKGPGASTLLSPSIPMARKHPTHEIKLENHGDNNITKEPNTVATSLMSCGWPGWFGLVWLDYCGKVSSGSAGRLRKIDLELLFKSGMLGGGRSLSNTVSPNLHSDKPCMSVLAITMSKRAAPLR